MPPVADAAPELVAFDFSQGLEDLSAYGAEVAIRGEDYLGEGTFLLRPDTGLSMGRGETQLTNLEQFEIALGFAKSQAGGTGALVGQHDRLEAEILPGGGIRFELSTTEGRFEVRTQPGLVLDTEAHDLVLGFDAEAGTMTVTLDGALVAQGQAGGMLTANGGHTLGLGKSFEPNIEAEIDSFAVRVAQSADAPQGPSQAAPEPAPAPDSQILAAVDFDGVMSEGIRLRDPDGAGVAGADGRDGFGFALDGRSKVIVSDRADVLEGLQGFEMTTAISKETATGHGTILSIAANLSFKVLRDGSLKLWLKTSTDDYEIRTEGGLLSTTDWHDVGVRFDGTLGEMAILLDGQEVATGGAWGAMPDKMLHHLMVGRAFGGSVEARIDDVRVTAGPNVGVDGFEFAAHGDADAAVAAAHDGASLASLHQNDHRTIDLAADAPSGHDLSGESSSLTDFTDTVLVG